MKNSLISMTVVKFIGIGSGTRDMVLSFWHEAGMKYQRSMLQGDIISARSVARWGWYVKRRTTVSLCEFRSQYFLFFPGLFGSPSHPSPAPRGPSALASGHRHGAHKTPASVYPAQHNSAPRFVTKFTLV